MPANADMADEVVAITGGARGIGRATAAAFIDAGATVAIGDLDFAAAQETADALGPRASAFELNVTDTQSFADFVSGVEEAHGRIDVLVNNAGIMPIGPFLEEDDATTDRVLEVNVRGVITGTRLVLPGMLGRGHGHVVNIASAVGRVAAPGGATYSASKYAVVGLSEALRLELRGSGVDVSIVLPSLVNTDLGSGVGAPRGIKLLEAGDVAAAVLGAVRAKRFESWVPWFGRPIFLVTSLLPQPLRDLVASLFRADRMLVDADPAKRAEYDSRVAKIETRLRD